VQVLSSDNILPTAVEISPPFDNSQACTYFESLEGMLVSVSDANVVSPTNSRDETWIIRSDLELERVFQDDPTGTGEVICLGANGHYEIDPPLKVGDQLLDILGVLEYSSGLYHVSLLAQPTQIPVSIYTPSPADSSGAAFTFGTFNLENLFDVVDDPAKDDPVLNATEYHRKLEKLALTIHELLGEPAFLAVQEAENEIVLNHLLARSEIEADYGVAWLDSPDGRGIDVALLYRHDQVTVLDFELWQGCTTLLDGLGPDGDRDVQDPHNEITCDSDGDGVLDGNRLFSRPPLVVHLEVELSDHELLPIWVVVNHWKSKREDTSSQTFTAPRRLEQAQFVAELVKEIEDAQPGAAVIVLGDLNAYIDSQPLAVLQQVGLWNAMTGIDRASRYTYIYQGVSQVLDHVLVNAPLAINRITAKSVHVNADFPYIYRGFESIFYRGSDHDPVVAAMRYWQNHAYLPVIKR
jgi:predicted extracellular nuclease